MEREELKSQVLHLLQLRGEVPEGEDGLVVTDDQTRNHETH